MDGKKINGYNNILKYIICLQWESYFIFNIFVFNFKESIYMLHRIVMQVFS